jgi:hypothetical protein
MKPGDVERELARLSELAERTRTQLDRATALVRETRSMVESKEAQSTKSRDGTSEGMPAQVEAVVK